ncbi:MAG: hypothetical protein ACOC2N_01795 [Spirochaetota bacterium]
MLYQFQLKRNLKSLLIPLIALGLIAASIAIIVLYHPLLGVFALLLAGFISYHLLKFFRNTLKSHIRTSEDGMVCATAMGSDSEVSWDEVTHSGWYTTDSGYRELFVYAEGKDQLLTIPPQYEGMEELSEEIRSHGLTMLSLYGEEIDGLAEALRRELVPEGEIIDDEEEAGQD